jgi:hypothetical protein
MPSKIGQVSQDFLVNATLPKHGSTYTVISHKFVIDTVKKELNNNNFFIEEESYRATHDAAIAVGVYKLTHKSDPELSMAFAWTNSYNKQVKFKAVVGTISNVNGAFMILGEQGSWIRKHTGTADLEAKEQIVNQIQKAGVYYKELINDKNTMKGIVLPKREQAKLLGLLFADYGILEVSGVSNVKQQMVKPGFVYNGGSDTLWAFYNHVIYAIQENHPKTWLEEQRMIHYIITNEFNMIPEPVISKELPLPEHDNSVNDTDTASDYIQTDIVSLIEEIESEESNPDLKIDSDKAEEEFVDSPMPDEVLEDLVQKHEEEEKYAEIVQEVESEIVDVLPKEEAVEELKTVNNEPEITLSIDDEEETEEEEVQNTEDQLESVDFHNAVTQEVENNDEEELLITEDSEEEDEDEFDFL